MVSLKGQQNWYSVCVCGGKRFREGMEVRCKWISEQSGPQGMSKKVANTCLSCFFLFHIQSQRSLMSYQLHGLCWFNISLTEGGEISQRQGLDSLRD